MEILDNMPHDRIYKNSQGDFDTQAEVLITTDPNTGKETLEEVRTQISD